MNSFKISLFFEEYGKYLNTYIHIYKQNRQFTVSYWAMLQKQYIDPAHTKLRVTKYNTISPAAYIWFNKWLDMIQNNSLYMLGERWCILIFWNVYSGVYCIQVGWGGNRRGHFHCLMYLCVTESGPWGTSGPKEDCNWALVPIISILYSKGAVDTHTTVSTTEIVSYE